MKHISLIVLSLVVTYTHLRYTLLRQTFMPELVCDQPIDTTLRNTTSSTYIAHTQWNTIHTYNVYTHTHTHIITVFLLLIWTL